MLKTLMPPLSAAADVDVVEADAAADDHLQLRGRVDVLGGRLGLAADEHHLGLGQLGLVVGHLSELAQALPGSDASKESEIRIFMDDLLLAPPGLARGADRPAGSAG